MENANYETAVLNSNLYKIFTGVYNDFRSKSSNDYIFELPPLEYQDFIDAIDKEKFLPTLFRASLKLLPITLKNFINVFPLLIILK